MSFRSTILRYVFDTLLLRSVILRCVFDTLPLRSVILRRVFDMLPLRSVILRCVFDTLPLRNVILRRVFDMSCLKIPCFTSVVLEFFTTAPYINSEMCVLRRVFDGHCSQNTLFSTNFRNGRAKKTEKHEPEPCFVQKARVFSVAEPCGTRGAG